MTNIIIGSGVTNIGEGAFSGCYALQRAYFRGNAPAAVGRYCFAVSPPSIVYRLPGATGWSTTFGGRPTALWLPRIDAYPRTFGVGQQEFAFTISWTSGMSLVVEISSTLSNPDWQVIQTHTLDSDSYQFGDPDWRNHPGRFYRERSPW